MPFSNLVDKRSKPLLLLHGFMQDARTWDSIRLPAGAHAFDYAAHRDGRMGSLIASVHEESVRMGGASVLVGYSMGGRIAALCALRHPDAVAGLVLESAGLGCIDEEDRTCCAERNEAWAAQLDDGSPLAFEEFINRWEDLPLFATQRELPASVQELQRRMRRACDPARLANQLRYAGVQTMPLERDTVESLTRLPFPVHYIVGTRDAKYSSLADRLPESFIVHRVNAGHNVHMENPQAYEDIIRKEFA
ncbi:alpha/beta fold hydrolase [Curtanaerobium respiraculi]|uniref:alpha/beta fold hydrolase n=1 Tax=Curtanaerobium respiraculi TaxID=2949669 RepID=UPI0024B373FC|nr:alpha/beta fold hydrolase [Curtanaerobium respiraculi]